MPVAALRLWLYHGDLADKCRSPTGVMPAPERLVSDGRRRTLQCLHIGQETTASGRD